ncbi:MAG: amidase [Balneolaceae bacterium]|nr:MAG: amidase [Balneolaceae bacterium]
MKLTRTLLVFCAGAAFAMFALAAGNLLILSDITKNTIIEAEKIIGLEFSDAQRDSLQPNLVSALNSYEAMRQVEIGNGVMPSLHFDPVPAGRTYITEQRPVNWNLPGDVAMPERFDDLAFYSVAELSVLIRQRKVTSEQLTMLFLDRLKTHGATLEAVITITEDLALEQARRADREIASGIYRGMLHGIPYGTKDLLALPGHKTTWGAMPYKDQVIDETATVIRKLEEAGAVHLAKLTLGALAWGDVWYGGQTRNPWNTSQGASGSSAGSASATSAGLVPFAIGSETLGSIVSPATRNGVTGLRPTYGRVSRHGAMALSWSMDKLGPITRSATDAAIVFNYIYGPDGLDPTVKDLPFNYDPEFDFQNLRIGFVKAAFDTDYGSASFDRRTLEVLESLGATLVPVELPELPFSDLTFILSAEAAAAFDELTRSGQDDLLVRQIRNAWPNVFRAARFIPAVEYIQANRIRTMVIEEMDRKIRDVDVYISPSFAGGNLALTNLTGHPCVVVPNGFTESGSPVSITFMGHLFDEGTVLSLARAYQEATDFHLQRPPLFQ